MKYPQYIKLLFTATSICFALASCQFPKYIKAADYNFNDYLIEPEIGMCTGKIWKKNNILIYEISKKKAKPIVRNLHEFRTDSIRYEIGILYKKMIIADDITNDNETFPIIINKDAKIILTGWKSYDSLRTIKYSERMK